MQTSRMTVFEPVDASSTYEETVTRLGTAIRVGVLPPGCRLPPERELADQLEISRSTLRQALATLTATGHLKAIRGRSGGTFVSESPPAASGAPFPRERLRALLDDRLALELAVAVLAAERAGNGDVARMEECLAAVEATREEGFAAYRRADAAFHLALAETSGSPRLVAGLTVLQGRLSDLLSEVGVPPAAREEDITHHRELLDAVSQGDVAGAVAVMRRHLESTERMVEEALEASSA